MPSVNEQAEHNLDVVELLLSDRPHTKVAKDLGVSEKSVRRWRAKHRPPGIVRVEDMRPGPARLPASMTEPFTLEEHVTFSTEDRTELHGKLDELLDKANTDPAAVKSMRVATWDGMVKNADGDAEIVRQYGVRLESARWSPSWPVVQQAAPVEVKVVTQPIAGAWDRIRSRGDNKVAVILPDTQIGFRYYTDTETYDPFHDDAAISVALKVLASLQPDKVILLGDFLDLPNFGTFEQEATFARTTQRAIDCGYVLLNMIKNVAGDAEIVLMEGKHDRRLEKMVTRNAMEAFGLRRADDISGWPVLSLPHLLRLSELGIRYEGGYPAGSYWINDRLKCIHGSLVRSGGSTAKAVVDAERASVIFGHIHRIETHYKTSDIHEGGSVRLAHTPGCLCRIDGAVPSAKGSTDLSGRPIRHYEDWQQGLSVVTYQDGDAPFSLESVFINTLEGHRVNYNGQVFMP
jgi:hypothetical protein